jgi:hypothetical protein
MRRGPASLHIIGFPPLSRLFLRRSEPGNRVERASFPGPETVYRETCAQAGGVALHMEEQFTSFVSGESLRSGVRRFGSAILRAIVSQVPRCALELCAHMQMCLPKMHAYMSTCVHACPHQTNNVLHADAVCNSMHVHVRGCPLE